MVLVWVIRSPAFGRLGSIEIHLAVRPGAETFSLFGSCSQDRECSTDTTGAFPPPEAALPTRLVNEEAREVGLFLTPRLAFLVSRPSDRSRVGLDAKQRFLKKGAREAALR